MAFMSKKGVSMMWQVIIMAVIAIMVLIILLLLVNKGVTPNIEKLLSFGATSG